MLISFSLGYLWCWFEILCLCNMRKYICLWLINFCTSIVLRGVLRLSFVYILNSWHLECLWKFVIEKWFPTRRKMWFFWGKWLLFSETRSYFYISTNLPERVWENNIDTIEHHLLSKICCSCPNDFTILHVERGFINRFMHEIRE